MNLKQPPAERTPLPGISGHGGTAREPDDEAIFADVMARLREEARAGRTPAELVLAAGRSFLGVPYASSSLEGTPERLAVTLRRFDCFTFVENAVVLASLAWQGQSAFPAYAAALRNVRYRGGIVAGYPSRLHYFTDWIHENARRGVVRDMTRQLGGRPFRKRICYMTAHARLYPTLEDRACRLQMREVERRISRRVRHEIPRDDVPSAAALIADGDLIAVLTDEEGLDCLHVGLAVHTGGHLHLLHASRQGGAVVVSPETLSAYLASEPRRSGILVARVRPR